MTLRRSSPLIAYFAVTGLEEIEAKLLADAQNKQSSSIAERYSTLYRFRMAYPIARHLAMDRSAE